MMKCNFTDCCGATQCKCCMDDTMQLSLAQKYQIDSFCISLLAAKIETITLAILYKCVHYISYIKLEYTRQCR